MRSSAIQSEAVHLVSGAAITSLPINLCHSRNGCNMTACQLPGAGAVWRECRLRSLLTGSRDLLPLIIAALTRRASQIVGPLDQGYGPVPLKCVPCGLFVLELLLLPMSPCSWRAPDQLRQTRLRAVPNASYRFFLQTIVGKQPDARLIHSLGPMNAPHGVPIEQAADHASSSVSAIEITVCPQLRPETNQRPLRISAEALQARPSRKYCDSVIAIDAPTKKGRRNQGPIL